ncbi:MAG: ATP-binding protein [Anaerolineae bacterium]|nr:ATP-binding protein [Anaerolineae bacterium]
MHFSERNRTAVATAVALTGIGGIGKTQLAVEFAHRYGRYFPGGVFWLNFADAQTMPAQVARCGRLEHLNLRPGFVQLSLEQQVRLVQQAWQEPIPRLLILITVNLKQHLPNGSHPMAAAVSC